MPKEASQDLNPNALLLLNRRAVRASASVSRYTYFKFKCPKEEGRVVIEIKDRVGGDVELVVGNCLCPQPTAENCHWTLAKDEVVTKKGEKRSALRPRAQLNLHAFHKHYYAGYCYIGVLGMPNSDVANASTSGENAGEVSFCLTVSFKGEWRVAGIRRVGKEASLEPVEESDGDEVDEGLQGHGRGTGLDDGAGIVEEAGRVKDHVQQYISLANPNLSQAASDGLGEGLPETITVEQLQGMACEEVCAWLNVLGMADTVVSVVRVERVPGKQLATMGVPELMGDLGMSKLQAKRVLLYSGREAC